MFSFYACFNFVVIYSSSDMIPASWSSSLQLLPEAPPPTRIMWRTKNTRDDDRSPRRRRRDGDSNMEQHL